MSERVRHYVFLAAVLVGSVVVSNVVSLALGTHHDAVPAPVILLSLITGCVNALFAVGIVLIYRSNRIINFAQASFGGAGAVLTLVLIREYGWPYYFAALAGIAGAALLGALCELLFIRRFVRASRLVLTVVTIGAGQLILGTATVVLPRLADDSLGDGAVGQLLARVDTPLTRLHFRWGAVLFTGDHFALLGATLVVAACLGAFFRFTSAGVAVRAAAENDDRAALLGVNTRSLATIVWVFAALLSGVAAVLLLPFQGVGSASAVGLGSGVLLRALAASVFGRFENIPAVVVAALSLNIVEQSVLFSTGRGDIATLLLFVVLLGGLLLQRAKLVRAEVAESGTWAATEEIRPIPPELAPLPAVRRATRWVIGVAAVITLGYPWIASPSQANTGALFAIYAIIAVSLVILVGWAGQISLGQWGLAGTGALVGGAMTATYHMPFLVGLLVASLVGAGVAVLLGLPALRIRGLFLAVTTLAFSFVVADILLNKRWFGWLLPDGPVNRPQLFFISTEDERAFYYVCLAGAAFAVFCALGLRRSRAGRVLIAMRDNERAAQAFGLNLVRVRLMTFALSGFLASFAGALFAHHQHSVTAQSFAPEQSIQMFLMAVIGGLGSALGVLAGPIYQAVFATFLTEWAFLASSVGVLFVLLLLPGGLGGLLFATRDMFLRRVAIRHRIFVPSLLADHLAGGELERVPLAPLTDLDGDVVEAPLRYRLSSRVGAAGASQAAKAWRF
jgi:branched-chain amino acid transport system permease protein